MGTSSLRSRRVKGRGWGRRKRIRGKTEEWWGRGVGGRGKRNACYKDPNWFISAVVEGRKILIGQSNNRTGL